MNPGEQYGERFWEEVRLLENIVEDVEDHSIEEQARKINWFLSEQCEELSLGHEKCRDVFDDPVLPAYESLLDYRNDEPHVIGCYGCGEMYRIDSNEMPDEFEELRVKGVIRAGSYNYGRVDS